MPKYVLTLRHPVTALFYRKATDERLILMASAVITPEDISCSGATPELTVRIEGLIAGRSGAVYEDIVPFTLALSGQMIVGRQRMPEPAPPS